MSDLLEDEDGAPYPDVVQGAVQSMIAEAVQAERDRCAALIQTRLDFHRPTPSDANPGTQVCNSRGCGDPWPCVDFRSLKALLAAIEGDTE